MRRRQMMTFLEVIIAMGLAMLVLTTLIFFYRQINDINSKMEKLEKSAFEQSYIELRLAQVMSQAVPPNNNDAFFYTNVNSLVLSFMNGVDLDKKFSNLVLGRFYLDKNKNFCLATWPSPKTWKAGEPIPMKKEVLLSDVDAVSYDFFVPPEKDRSRISKGSITVEPKATWHKDWSKDYKQLPAMIRIHLTKKGGEVLTFAYPFPNSPMVIMYE